MVGFSHSVWRQAEQIHLLFPGALCLFRPERGQTHVFERMAGPDLQNKETRSTAHGMFWSHHISHAAFGQLAGGKGRATISESLYPGEAASQVAGTWLRRHIVTHSSLGLPGTSRHFQASSCLRAGGRNLLTSTHQPCGFK